MIKSHEKVLAYLLKKDSNTNEVRLSSSEYNELEMDEKEFIRALYFLQEGQYIRIIKISPHKNLSMGCQLALCENGAEYFEKKGKTSGKHIQTCSILDTIDYINYCIGYGCIEIR